MKSQLILAVCISIFYACDPSNKILIKKDSVKSTDRYSYKYKHKVHEDDGTPLSSIHQTILKERSADSNIKYMVYDVITLNSNAFILEDSIYLLINDAVFPIKVHSQESNIDSRIRENTSSIITVDSTAVFVASGFSQYKRKVFKITYELNSETTHRIKGCEDLKFRYYTGPHMITTSVRSPDLKEIQTLLTL